jgi:hypothetical protein
MTRLIDRRLLLTGALGAAALGGPQSSQAASVREAMPLLARNEGDWAGTYTFVSTTGEILDQHGVAIRVRLSADPAHAYRQETRYDWPDGRTEERVFEAQFADRRLIWDDGRIAGQMWEIDDRTLYLHFAFATMPGVACFEMVQISADGQKRGRTWLWYREEALYQYVLVDESRVGPRPEA